MLQFSMHFEANSIKDNPKNDYIIHMLWICNSWTIRNPKLAQGPGAPHRLMEKQHDVDINRGSSWLTWNWSRATYEFAMKNEKHHQCACRPFVVYSFELLWNCKFTNTNPWKLSEPLKLGCLPFAMKLGCLPSTKWQETKISNDGEGLPHVVMGARIFEHKQQWD